MKQSVSHWALQPQIIVLVTVLGVVGGLLLTNWIVARWQRVTARVEVAAPQIEAAQTKASASPPPKALPDGEVERTAARVREVSALVMGLTLLVVQEAVAGNPVASSEALTERFISRHLLPPTIRASSARAVLESETAVLYVRYRVEPLALEVVSLGRMPEDGAPIIGRIVTGSDEHSALFIARQIKGAMLPDPFLPAAQVIALNWSIEPWRERAFAQEEVEQIQHALRTAQPKP
ncbi:MAG: hypothetical protein JST84_11380 [Acidobacteria bacterium]|nr:hypothetical protein [Acidobacteriota bacterium]